MPWALGQLRTKVNQPLRKQMVWINFNSQAFPFKATDDFQDIAAQLS